MFPIWRGMWWLARGDLFILWVVAERVVLSFKVCKDESTPVKYGNVRGVPCAEVFVGYFSIYYLGYCCKTGWETFMWVNYFLIVIKWRWIFDWLYKYKYQYITSYSTLLQLLIHTLISFLWTKISIIPVLFFVFSLFLSLKSSQSHTFCN